MHTALPRSMNFVQSNYTNYRRGLYNIHNRLVEDQHQEYNTITIIVQGGSRADGTH